MVVWQHRGRQTSSSAGRRLRRVASQLLKNNTAGEQEYLSSTSGRVLAKISQGERGIPTHLVRQPTSFRPVHVGMDGRLLKSEVVALKTALAEHDHDQASPPPRALDLGDPDRKGYVVGDSGLPTRREELEQLLVTLGPRPHLTLADCTPSGVTAQRDFFRENGFVIVEDILQGASLRAAQTVFRAAMEQPLANWKNAQRGGGRRETEPWFYLEPRKDMCAHAHAVLAARSHRPFIASHSGHACKQVRQRTNNVCTGTSTFLWTTYSTQSYWRSLIAHNCYH